VRLVWNSAENFVESSFARFVQMLHQRRVGPALALSVVSPAFPAKILWKLNVPPLLRTNVPKPVG